MKRKLLSRIFWVLVGVFFGCGCGYIAYLSASINSL